MEKTYLMVKPDGVQRHLIGKLVQRFEEKGFQLIGAKMFRLTREQAEYHYEEHKDKPFFGELVAFITSGPVFGMVWQGDNIVALSRAMMGKTNPLDAAPGTIRGDYALNTGNNIIHGSDSPQSADREISNFFRPEELMTGDYPVGLPLNTVTDKVIPVQ
ncbi:nucleoside-diphosphate kinase [Paenibacillus allorhizosphaerae]|uniref:Nucleoside diphosphate kinase n=1 Tax=Paenibacillus allorhizosphaerae TaxID=2849866 RepID=A0ABM8VHR9_9BACL|nr:nucleoside-diphosphate kinase [Paenibacillus allorhizosphaerae]CAG7642921.1 Nucleoside diphosphate kinase [Paenibacillus allorhizosphaerae]